MNNPQTAVYSIPQRFYSLDVIRGLAALSIVFWHWKHLLIQGLTDVNYSIQPLYVVFFAFYTNGYLAVNLFFCLSGFVFFWLYSDRIGHRNISTRTFIVARISRLYPLHLATLFIVLAGQRIVLWRTGNYFICQKNDLYHFVLNIFFASNWGFHHGHSFNTPVWSVSIEVLLYAMFFIICLAGAAKIWSMCLMAAVGLLMSRFHWNPVLWLAVFLFFSGGLIFKLYVWLLKMRIVDGLAKPLFVLTLMCWIVAIVEMRFGVLEAVHQYSPWAKNIISSLIFLTTILTSVILETKRGHLCVRMSFLGDISYSSYLIHFPLQIYFFIITGMLGVSFTFYYSILSLVLFFSVLLTLSFLSHRYFERPVQDRIRARFSRTDANVL